MRTLLITITVLLVAMFRTSVAQDDIDVLVAVAAGANTDNSAFIAGELQASVAVAMQNTGIQSRSFQFRPYILLAAFPGTGPTTTFSAHEFLSNQVDPLLANARDTALLTLGLDVQSYDLVVMVVPAPLLDQYGTELCGSARTLDSPFTGYSPPRSRPEETAFSILLSDAAGCEGVRGRITGHEIGHIFGGDHQSTDQIAGVVDAPSSFTDPDVIDDDPGFPVSYNHPMIHFDEDMKLDEYSLMVSGGNGFPRNLWSNAEPGAVFAGTTLPAGDSDADMKRLILEWWDTVAAYRPIVLPSSPGPQEPDLVDALFDGCTIFGAYGFTGTWDSTTLLPDEYFEAEYSHGGPFTSWYEGGEICLPRNSQISTFEIRVRIGRDECDPLNENCFSEWVYDIVTGNGCGGSSW